MAIVKKTREKINYSAEIQELLISLMISDPELFVRCQNILRAQYFDNHLKPVITLILEHSEKFKGLPSPEIIKAKTSVDIKQISDLQPSVKEWFMDNVEKFCRHKALETAILKSADLIEEGYYGDVEALVKEAVLVSLKRDLGTDYFFDPKTRLQKLLDANGSLSTGWKTVDEIIFNLGRGELAIFTAISGGGKSVLLQNLAINWALQGHNVIYFTFELSEELVAKRIDSMITGIPNIRIFKNMDTVEYMVKAVSQKAGGIQIVYMRPGTNTNDIRAYLKEYEIQNNRRPDQILVDYLDLMYPNSKRIDVSNFFAKDKFVSEELRGLGMELGLTVATASQLNRGGYDEMNPNSSNIAGGISKAYTADLVVNISNTPASRERGEITLSFIKTRNSGGVGKHLAMRFDVDTLRILDMNDDGSGQPPIHTSPDETAEAIAAKAILDKFHKPKTNLIGSSDDKPVFDNTAAGSSINAERPPNKVSPTLQRLLDKTKGSI